MRAMRYERGGGEGGGSDASDVSEGGDAKVRLTRPRREGSPACARIEGEGAKGAGQKEEGTLARRR